jgi:hypothetical protein
MYAVHNVIPYVIELNDSGQGFQPSWDVRDPTVEKLRAAWKLLLGKLTGPGVRGKVVDSTGAPALDAQVTVHRLSASTLGDFTWKVKRDGTYHLVLLPGSYHLTFKYAAKTIDKDVTVAGTRVDLNIQI